MELTLDKDEIKKVVLEWAQVKFPGAFNTAMFGTTYSNEFCTLTFEQPEAAEGK